MFTSIAEVQTNGTTDPRVHSRGPSETPVLIVEDLSVSAPQRNRLVLDSVSLSVAAGETLGIVGESGSGKTTLARCLTRQEEPLNIIGGAIRFAGEDVVKASMRTMRALRGRRIGLVEQDPIASFDPLFTVGDQIAEFVASHRDAIADASGVAPADALGATLSRLQAFGVRDTTDALRAWPHQWSRGMLQRALFALATAPAPELLILDEPTAALDAPVADRLVADVARLAGARGLATILITHDLGLAATACDRILVLRDGDPVETAETKALLGDARTDYTRALVASAAW
ncbi:MAG: ABC transporter ATP-binding protein [Pseudomonadota bacterium]